MTDEQKLGERLAAIETGYLQALQLNLWYRAALVDAGLMTEDMDARRSARTADIQAGLAAMAAMWPKPPKPRRKKRRLTGQTQDDVDLRVIGALLDSLVAFRGIPLEERRDAVAAWLRLIEKHRGVAYDMGDALVVASLSDWLEDSK